MGWYKVYKTFRNGQYPSKGELKEYIEVPKGTKLDDVKGYAESWADSTPGGHNYGYKVCWSRVSRPSRIWLKREWTKTMKLIEARQDYVKKLELMLKKQS